MDPDANLREQLEMAKAIIKTWDDSNADGTLTAAMYEAVAYQGEELARLVVALDQWIVNGGFMPNRWQNNR